MNTCIDCATDIGPQSTRCLACSIAFRRGQARPRRVVECPDKLAMEREERASSARGAFVDALTERITKGRTMQEDVCKLNAGLTEVRLIGRGLEGRGDMHMNRIEWLEVRVAALIKRVSELEATDE